MANGDLDLLLTPADFVHPDHPCELVFEERHVTAAWTGNPLSEEPLGQSDARPGRNSFKTLRRENFHSPSTLCNSSS
ncbi:MAG: hypothetical protein WA957_01915 [Alteraurantiacibacter sp.]